MIYSNDFKNAVIFKNWSLATPGNYAVSEYFSGVEAANPSGNKNLKCIKFYNVRNVLKAQLNFEYDLLDDLTKEISSVL
jgi:hypothetical protein